MYDTLCDLVRYTHQLDFEGFKLIIDDEGSTELRATSKNSDTLLKAQLKQKLPVFARPEFDKHNSIGFTNLEVLSAYLRSSVFDKDTTITPITTSSTNFVKALQFKSMNGHTCTYKTMIPEVAKRKIKTIKRTAAFSPKLSFGINSSTFNEFRQLGSVLSKFSPTFSFEVEDGKLYAVLGMIENQAKIPLCAVSDDIDPSMEFNFAITTSILKQAPNVEDVRINISEQTRDMIIEFETEQASYSFTVVSKN